MLIKVSKTSKYNEYKDGELGSCAAPRKSQLFGFVGIVSVLLTLCQQIHRTLAGISPPLLCKSLGVLVVRNISRFYSAQLPKSRYYSG